MLPVLLDLRTKRRAPATLPMTALMAEMRLCDASAREVSEPIEVRITQSLDLFESSVITEGISCDVRRRGRVNTNGLIYLSLHFSAFIWSCLADLAQ